MATHFALKLNTLSRSSDEVTKFPEKQSVRLVKNIIS